MYALLGGFYLRVACVVGSMAIGGGNRNAGRSPSLSCSGGLGEAAREEGRFVGLRGLERATENGALEGKRGLVSDLCDRMLP